MSSETAAGIDEEASNWVVRIDRGLTREESAELSAWMESSPRRRGALLRTQAAWSMLDRARALDTVGAREDDADEPIVQPKTRRQVIGLGGLAATLVAGLTWYGWPAGESFATTTGEIRRLPLEDGSLALVNSASGIRVAYSRGRRDIQLSHGEAWFKVARNKARPFTVSAGPARVQAVGTEFDVRRHEGFSEVIVTEGVVRIWSTLTTARPVMVPAGHRAWISDRSGVKLAALSAADMDQQLAWREGRIILDNMTLAAAAREFNRYNTTKMVIDPALGQERMVGWFRIDDIDGFVKASSTLVGARIRRNGKIISIEK